VTDMLLPAGRDSQADDSDVEQTGEEDGGRDIPTDPGVHG